MEEYKSNSNKSKEEAPTEVKRVEKPVIQGSAKTKKNKDLKKFSDVFISDDASNVGSYIVQDVLLPTLKDTISEIIKNSIDMILFGESGRSRNRNRDNKPSYRSFYEERERGYSNRREQTRSLYSFDDILLDSRADAEEVLDSMIDIIERYGIVSVADMYDLVGVTGQYTDNKYGWTDLRTAHVERDRSGAYYIKMPRALPL